MSTEIVAVRPTRIELLKMRRRRTLAQVVLDILQRELDELIVKLFEFLRERASLRNQSHKLLQEAYSLFAEAQAVIGVRKLEELSWGVPDIFNVEVKTTASTYTFELNKVAMGLPSYPFTETSAKLDSAVSKMEEALHLLTQLTEVEATLRKLLEAIAVAKQRVNGIKYVAIPQLDKTITFIETLLEEEEREEAIRVRIIQSKRKERRAPGSS